MVHGPFESNWYAVCGCLEKTRDAGHTVPGNEGGNFGDRDEFLLFPFLIPTPNDNALWLSGREADGQWFPGGWSVSHCSHCRAKSTVTSSVSNHGVWANSSSCSHPGSVSEEQSFPLDSNLGGGVMLIPSNVVLNCVCVCLVANSCKRSFKICVVSIKTNPKYIYPEPHCWRPSIIRSWHHFLGSFWSWARNGGPKRKIIVCKRADFAMVRAVKGRDNFGICVYHTRTWRHRSLVLFLSLSLCLSVSVSPLRALLRSKVPQKRMADLLWFQLKLSMLFIGKSISGTIIIELSHISTEMNHQTQENTMPHFLFVVPCHSWINLFQCLLCAVQLKAEEWLPWHSQLFCCAECEHNSTYRILADVSWAEAYGVTSHSEFPLTSTSRVELLLCI